MSGTPGASLTWSDLHVFGFFPKSRASPRLGENFFFLIIFVVVKLQWIRKRLPNTIWGSSVRCSLRTRGSPVWYYAHPGLRPSTFWGRRLGMCLLLSIGGHKIKAERSSLRSLGIWERTWVVATVYCLHPVLARQNRWSGRQPEEPPSSSPVDAFVPSYTTREPYPGRVVLITIPFYMWSNWGLKRWSRSHLWW